MLNPFRGVMQTIEADHVDAASVDGLRWGLYISDASIYSFIDMNSVAPFHSADVKYGEWSEAGGLNRSPSLPSMNQARVRERGEEILGLVKANVSQLPFPLEDRYERWLLDDADGLPVVLLESAYESGEVKYSSNTLWRIGQPALREFGKDANGESRAELLQSRINQACKRGTTVWVKRDAGGGGQCIARPGEDAEPYFDADRFPKFGLRQNWNDTETAALVADYLHWLSPWLLIMQPQDEETVERLIQQAVEYPVRLYQIRRLLPASVLARKAVKAALVQAELSRIER